MRYVSEVTSLLAIELTNYQAEDLKEGLLAHAKDFSQDEQQRDTDDPYMVSDDDRRKKLAQVQNLLGTQYVQIPRDITATR